MSKFSRTLLILLISSIAGGVAIGPWGVSSASAQTYTQLQVLLPGETADPGSTGGKSGQPAAQTIGVAFEILVRACDSSWNT